MESIGIKKRCSRCKVYKNLVSENISGEVVFNFPKDKYRKDGFRTYCKECVKKERDELKEDPEKHQRLKESSKRWAENNGERQKFLLKRNSVRRRYGMSLEVFERLKAEAKQCPICGDILNNILNDSQSKVMDHDHITGRVRGFICNDCNRALGIFHDSEEILEKALEWVKG